MGCCAGSFQKISDDNTNRPSIRRVSQIPINPSNFIKLNKGKLLDFYKIVNHLGKGAYGHVRLGVHKQTQMKRAIKTINKKHISSDLTENSEWFAEIDILKQLDHPNIVKLYEFYEDAKCYHLVTEFITGGELFDYIIKSKMLSEPAAANYMRQILSAVHYCHQRNIVHRDIKPENLLLEMNDDNITIKMIDFGTSAIFKSGSRMTHRYGTSYYIAPEVIKRNYDEKCDVWSCGVILYILLSGTPPFYGHDDDEIMERIKIGRYSFSSPEWNAISKEAKSLIWRMLQYNPGRRISSIDALNDKWILDNCNKTQNIVSLPALDNLKNFRAGQKLQHAVYTFITTQLLNREEIKKLTETFQAMDVNSDGKLSYQELIDAYSSTLGIEDAIQKVEQIMKSADMDRSGYIDYSEFIAATMETDKLLSKQNLEMAFSAFDVDGNGTISANELRKIFEAHSGMEDTIWQQIIEQVDKNGDGEIDINEFKDMMLARI